jgi:hypothetical protein
MLTCTAFACFFANAAAAADTVVTRGATAWRFAGGVTRLDDAGGGRLGTKRFFLFGDTIKGSDIRTQKDRTQITHTTPKHHHYPQLKPPGQLGPQEPPKNAKQFQGHRGVKYNGWICERIIILWAEGGEKMNYESRVFQKGMTPHQTLPA